MCELRAWAGHATSALLHAAAGYPARVSWQQAHLQQPLPKIYVTGYQSNNTTNGRLAGLIIDKDMEKSVANLRRIFEDCLAARVDREMTVKPDTAEQSSAEHADQIQLPWGALDGLLAWEGVLTCEDSTSTSGHVKAGQVGLFSETGFFQRCSHVPLSKHGHRCSIRAHPHT